ncbi:MAG: hypothetical protein SO091_06920, partial [Oscillospiraceae bacterium]|nr:hypothetical protein [Oscillospiraceae bacterium]
PMPPGAAAVEIAAMVFIVYPFFSFAAHATLSHFVLYHAAKKLSRRMSENAGKSQRKSASFIRSETLPFYFYAVLIP